MSIKKNAVGRILFILTVVIVTFVFCAATSHAAKVTVLSKEKLRRTGEYTYSYNKKGQLTKVKFNGQKYRTFKYDKKGRLIRVNTSKLFGDPKSTLTFKYNKKRNRLIKSIGTGKGIKSTTTYYYKNNSAKRPYTIITETTSKRGDSHAYYNFNLKWNKYNLPTKWEEYAGNAYKKTYDKKGNLTSYTYDGHKEKYKNKYVKKHKKNYFIQRRYYKTKKKKTKTVWNKTCYYKTIKVKTKKQAKAAKKARYWIVDHRLPTIYYYDY